MFIHYVIGQHGRYYAYWTREELKLWLKNSGAKLRSVDGLPNDEWEKLRTWAVEFPPTLGGYYKRNNEYVIANISS